MIYIAVGCALLALLVWGGRRPILKRREWRLGAGAGAVAAFAGAAFVAMKGGWELAIALLAIGVWLAASTRRAGSAAPAPRPAAMSLAEARAMLGVDEDATPEEIQAAYTRLMRLAHPDKGGTTGLAAQLNAARDRLVRK